MAVISEVVKSISDRNWYLTDNFDLAINNPAFGEDNRLLSTALADNVVAITLPPLTSAESDQVIGGERRINVQMFEAFRLSITFRDFNGGQLRQYFESIWAIQQFEYFDKIKTTLTITSGTHKTSLFHSTDCLITSVGGFSLNSSETNIGEFEVAFITPNYTSDAVVNFGTKDFSNIFDKNEIIK